MKEFKKILLGSIYISYENRTAILKSISAPIVLLILLSFLDFFETGLTINLIVGIAGLGLQTYIAISVHRVILLGERTDYFNLQKWTPRETSFLLKTIATVLMIIPFVILGSNVSMSMVITLGVIGLLIISRFFLVFPSIAVDEPLSFKDSWNLTKNYKTLMAIAVVFFPILLSIPQWLLEYIPYSAPAGEILSILMMVLSVAALSLTFQTIKNEANK